MIMAADPTFSPDNETPAGDATFAAKWLRDLVESAPSLLAEYERTMADPGVQEVWPETEAALQTLQRLRRGDEVEPEEIVTLASTLMLLAWLTPLAIPSK